MTNLLYITKEYVEFSKKLHSEKDRDNFFSSIKKIVDNEYKEKYNHQYINIDDYKKLAQDIFNNKMNFEKLLVTYQKNEPDNYKEWQNKDFSKIATGQYIAEKENFTIDDMKITDILRYYACATLVECILKKKIKTEYKEIFTNTLWLGDEAIKTFFLDLNGPILEKHNKKHDSHCDSYLELRFYSFLFNLSKTNEKQLKNMDNPFKRMNRVYTDLYDIDSDYMLAEIVVYYIESIYDMIDYLNKTTKQYDKSYNSFINFIKDYEDLRLFIEEITYL